MAHAAPFKPVEPTVAGTLSIDADEVLTLVTVLRCVGGVPYGNRGIADGILSALEALAPGCTDDDYDHSLTSEGSITLY